SDAALTVIHPGRSTTRMLTSSATVISSQCATAGNLLRLATCWAAACTAARKPSASTMASVAGTRGPGGVNLRPVAAATSWLKICMWPSHHVQSFLPTTGLITFHCSYSRLMLRLGHPAHPGPRRNLVRHRWYLLQTRAFVHHR